MILTVCTPSITDPRSIVTDSAYLQPEQNIARHQLIARSADRSISRHLGQVSAAQLEISWPQILSGQYDRPLSSRRRGHLSNWTERGLLSIYITNVVWDTGTYIPYSETFRISANKF